MYALQRFELQFDSKTLTFQNGVLENILIVIIGCNGSIFEQSQQHLGLIIAIR